MSSKKQISVAESRKMYRRVVVTGIGAITPYGQQANFFEELVAGHSAIGELTAVADDIKSY